MKVKFDVTTQTTTFPESFISECGIDGTETRDLVVGKITDKEFGGRTPQYRPVSVTETRSLSFKHLLPFYLPSQQSANSRVTRPSCVLGHPSSS